MGESRGVVSTVDRAKRRPGGSKAPCAKIPERCRWVDVCTSLTLSSHITSSWLGMFDNSCALPYTEKFFVLQ